MSQRDRAIKHFKKTGVINPWLKERLQWDLRLLYELFPELSSKINLTVSFAPFKENSK